MKSTLGVICLATVASMAQADLLQTRNLRTHTQPKKKQESAFISELVEEDMKFWSRELQGSGRRKLAVADKKKGKAAEEDKKFWARQLGTSARRKE